MERGRGPAPKPEFTLNPVRAVRDHIAHQDQLGANDAASPLPPQAGLHISRCPRPASLDRPPDPRAVAGDASVLSPKTQAIIRKFIAEGGKIVVPKPKEPGK